MLTGAVDRPNNFLFHFELRGVEERAITSHAEAQEVLPKADEPSVISRSLSFIRGIGQREEDGLIFRPLLSRLVEDRSLSNLKRH